MDHTHCFTCGGYLDASVANIDKVQDPKIYGLFPAFVALMKKDVVLAACKKLESLKATDVKAIVDGIPAAWEVPLAAREALASLIVQRAAFVADNMLATLTPVCWPPKSQSLFKEQES